MKVRVEPDCYILENIGTEFNVSKKNISRRKV